MHLVEIFFNSAKYGAFLRMGLGGTSRPRSSHMCCSIGSFTVLRASKCHLTPLYKGCTDHRSEDGSAELSLQPPLLGTSSREERGDLRGGEEFR